MSLAVLAAGAPPLPRKVRELLDERLAAPDLELPVLRDSAMQVIALADDEDCDARRLAEILQRDLALASHVLRVANSAAYAPREPIVSLQQAISRLGFPTVREIAIAVAVKSKVFDMPGHGTRVREIWRHSAAAAVFAREIARRRRSNVEAGFLCGLLHDVGKPLIAQVLSEESRKHTGRPVPAALLESAMDAYHVSLGARMVKRWNLPDWVADAIEKHHDLEVSGEHEELARTTNLADELTHWALGIGRSKADFPAELPVIQAMNLYGDEVVALLELRDEVLDTVEAFL